jgi:hypothetical protein
VDAPEPRGVGVSGSLVAFSASCALLEGGSREGARERTQPVMRYL